MICIIHCRSWFDFWWPLQQFKTENASLLSLLPWNITQQVKTVMKRKILLKKANWFLCKVIIPKLWSFVYCCKIFHKFTCLWGINWKINWVLSPIWNNHNLEACIDFKSSCFFQQFRSLFCTMFWLFKQRFRKKRQKWCFFCFKMVAKVTVQCLLMR